MMSSPPATPDAPPQPPARFHPQYKFVSDDKSEEEFGSIDDEPSVDLSIIVPSYNEETRLPIMLDETLEYLEKRKRNTPGFVYEVIIVDDGSTDNTTQVGLSYSEKFGCDKVRVLTLECNYGKGGAIRKGMLHARGRNLLMADADGASQFSDIESLEQGLSLINLKKHGMAVSIGSRAHLQEAAIAQRSFLRTILMYGFHMLVYIMCVQGIKDTQCGFKLFTREGARRIFRVLHVEGWAFDCEMLYIAERLSIPMVEVAVNWQEIEGSKIVPFWSWLQMARDLLSIRIHYVLGLWCLHDDIVSTWTTRSPHSDSANT